MSTKEQLRDMSSRFEGIKIAMTQDKNGHILKLAIHPSDTPEDVMRDPVGTRYLVVVVRLNDEDKPVHSQTSLEASSAVRSAAMLCADQRFQAWICQKGLAEEISESAAVEFIRSYCGIKSRSELKSNTDARKRFLALRDEFADNLRQGLVK